MTWSRLLNAVIASRLIRFYIKLRLMLLSVHLIEIRFNRPMHVVLARCDRGLPATKVLMSCSEHYQLAPLSA